MDSNIREVPGGHDIWGNYGDRLGLKGDTLRAANANKEKRFITINAYRNLSYNRVLIDGKPFDVAIVRNEEFDIKTIVAFPGQKLIHGGLVEMTVEGVLSRWLITELDPMDEITSKGVMERCNYLMKWINNDGELIERYARIVDGTKYLVGVEGNKIMEIGTARIAVTMARDSETLKLGRGQRFLIDDMESNEVLAYEINKSNRFFNVFNDAGVFRYIMGECAVENGDNLELHIANYYDWKPKHEKIESDVSAQYRDVEFEDIVAERQEKDKDRYIEIETKNSWL